MGDVPRGNRTPIALWQRPAHPHSSRPLLLSSASDLRSSAMAQHRGRASGGGLRFT
jgi:hypothetical protein